LRARELGRVKEGWRYFAERANELPKVREMMNEWDRVVQFSLDGEDPFYLTFSGGAVAFSDGTHGKPDLTLKGAEDIFYKLMTGEFDRIKAFMLGQFKFDGTLKDAAKFADIGDAVRKSVKFPP
jgi:putative sterol carrier protein